VYVCCPQVINRDSGKYTFSISCFMLELYQDSLMDLLLPPQPKGKVRQAALRSMSVRAVAGP
jgi:hypothetical protein